MVLQADFDLWRNKQWERNVPTANISFEFAITRNHLLANAIATTLASALQIIYAFTVSLLVRAVLIATRLPGRDAAEPQTLTDNGAS